MDYISNKKNFLWHKPVLLNESINNLVTDKNGIYVDATFGLGGHSNAILNKLDKNGILIAFDQDEDSIEKNIIKDKRFNLFHENFINIKNFLYDKYSIKKVSGILADLGVSSFQINDPNRGFSNKINCILDMRMNRKIGLSAQEVINKYSKIELSNIFKKYGQFLNPKKIVKKILDKRTKKKIITSMDLINLFPKYGSFKIRKRFLSRLFQSIRIEVNNELNSLIVLLIESSKILVPMGRIAIISYHSLEDRIVKKFFKKKIFFIKEKKINFVSPFNMIHKKVIKPTIEEINKNPRSRSAKLRIAEKK